MSSKGKIFFIASCLTTATIIYKVHTYQEDEQVVCVDAKYNFKFFKIFLLKRMRSGVFRDFERKREKIEAEANKLNNLEMIKAQIELENKLNKKD